MVGSAVIDPLTLGVEKGLLINVKNINRQTQSFVMLRYKGWYRYTLHFLMNVGINSNHFSFQHWNWGAINHVALRHITCYGGIFN